MDNEIQAISNATEFERMMTISTTLWEPLEDGDLEEPRPTEPFTFRCMRTDAQRERMERMWLLCTTLFIRRLRTVCMNLEYQHALLKDRASAARLMGRVLENEARILREKRVFAVEVIMEAIVYVTWGSPTLRKEAKKFIDLTRALTAPVYSRSQVLFH